MKKRMYFFMLSLPGLFLLFSGCGRQSLLREHALSDEADQPLLEQLSAELGVLAGLNDSVSYYFTLAGQSSDPAVRREYEERLGRFDLLFHQSEERCYDIENQMNEIHHCGTQDECDNMMDSHGMWKHRSGNASLSDDHCSLMDEINTDCSELEDILSVHDGVCTL